jgi:hypothetical protein
MSSKMVSPGTGVLMITLNASVAQSTSCCESH